MAVYETYDMEAYKGDTFNGVQFTVHVNGSPVNLTGAFIKVDFRQGSATGKIVKQISTVLGGVTLVTPASGIFQIDSFLCTLDAYVYYYDIHMEFAGITKTYVRGTFTVIEDITD